jgi:hypothetical protein
VNRLAKAVFAAAPQVRYVATYQHGQLKLNQRDDLSGASAPESDKYEELLVNPTVLTLLTQRGEIDCGGLSYVLVRYGRFFQFVARVPGGHVSIALEPSIDLAIVERIRKVISEHARE